MIVFLTLLAAALSAPPALSGTLARATFESTVEAACRRANISAGRVSWLLADSGDGIVPNSRWHDPNQPIPLGSLVKPFAALAYAQGHDFRYPEMECRGRENGCWLPSGHKRIGIVNALARSCNSYFRQLSQAIQPAQIEALTRRFGLTPPPAEAPAAAYLGLGPDWKIAPIDLMRAYRELPRRSQQPGVAAILVGLREAARNGTASGISAGHADMLAKTGTAPCTHTGLAPASNGDGFVILLGPANQPRRTLLLRVHGVPGRVAAGLAGDVWRQLTATAGVPQ